MISVIMPTMWVGSHYVDMLKTFNEHPLIGEIIVIDNDVEITDASIFSLSKVRHIPQEKNIYVNPAWNLGAKLAQYDKLCFYSDDVKFNSVILDKVYDSITTTNGLIGFKNNCAWETSISVDDGSKFHLEATEKPNSFYAICFFVHKENYYEIPEEFKIYYGDTYLFYRNRHAGRTNFQICDVKALTLLSTTSSMEEFRSIKEEEKKLYIEFLQPYGFDM